MQAPSKNSSVVAPTSTGGLTISTKHEIPPLFASLGERNPVVYERFYAPWLGQYWYVFEWNGGDRFLGMTTRKDERERSYGIFSLEQLGELTGPFAMKVVQDRLWQPITLRELWKQDRQRALGR